jgi:pimeloyl-ACP methyl ester carboxylesterase
MVHHVDALGMRIGYRRTGHGPPVILLHGGMCDSRVWRLQIEGLCDDFTVLAWDAPGCGASSDPPAGLGLTGYADCVAALLDAEGLGPAHVVGHSFGGGLALQLGVQHPSTCRSLVIAGGYAGWKGSLPAEEVEARLQLALRLADTLPATVTPESLPGLFSSEIPPGLMQELTQAMSEVRAPGTRVMAQAFAEADLRDSLAEISMPTLLLYGDTDQRAPRPIAEALHAAIPASELVMLPGVGHESYLEAPQAFNAEVRRFLGAVP